MSDKTIYRTDKSAESGNAFTRIDNRVINNTSLTPAARLALVYLLSKPDNWEVRDSDLRRYLEVGIKKLQSVILELRQAGYLVRNQRKDEQGRWYTTSMLVFEDPELNSPVGQNPTSGKFTAGQKPSGRLRLDGNRPDGNGWTVNVQSNNNVVTNDGRQTNEEKTNDDEQPAPAAVLASPSLPVELENAHTLREEEAAESGWLFDLLRAEPRWQRDNQATGREFPSVATRDKYLEYARQWGQAGVTRAVTHALGKGDKFEDLPAFLNFVLKFTPRDQATNSNGHQAGGETQSEKRYTVLSSAGGENGVIPWVEDFRAAGHRPMTLSEARQEKARLDQAEAERRQARQQTAEEIEQIEAIRAKFERRVAAANGVKQQ